jgi:hypothetical protein
MRLFGLPPLRLLVVAMVPTLWAIALYMLKLANKRESVAYLLLWQRVVKRVGSGRGLRRFETSMSLFLQLAFIALLTLAVGRPRFAGQQQAGRAIVFVLDNSASMHAFEGRKERFEIARARLSSLLANLADSDEVALVVTAPPSVLVPLGPRTASFVAAVDRVRAAEEPGQLGEAVKEARALLSARQSLHPGSANGVHIITDGSEALPQFLDSLPMAVDTVGRARENLGITALGARLNPSLANTVRVFVEVGNFGTRRGRADLRLSVDGHLFAVTPVELGPGSRLQRSFSTALSERGELSARLDRITIDGAADALAVDDVANASMPRNGEVKIGLAATNPFIVSALVAQSRYRIEPLDAAHIATQNRDYAAVLIEGALPAQLPPGGYVIFAPTGGAGDLPMRVTSTLAQPTFTDWRDDHPALRSVSLADVVVARSAKVVLGSDTTALASFFDEPLIWAVDDGRRRAVVVGFDPSDSNFPLHAGFAVLIYNAIAWVSADSPASAPERTRVIDARESDIAPTKLSAQRGSPSSSPRFIDRELWPLCLWLALALLLIEWWTYHTRVTS